MLGIHIHFKCKRCGRGWFVFEEEAKKGKEGFKRCCLAPVIDDYGEVVTCATSVWESYVFDYWGEE